MSQQANIQELEEKIRIAFNEITAEMRQNIFCEYVMVIKNKIGYDFFSLIFFLIFLNRVENKARMYKENVLTYTGMWNSLYGEKKLIRLKLISDRKYRKN